MNATSSTAQKKDQPNGPLEGRVVVEYGDKGALSIDLFLATDGARFEIDSRCGGLQEQYTASGWVDGETVSQFVTEFLESLRQRHKINSTPSVAKSFAAELAPGFVAGQGRIFARRHDNASVPVLAKLVEDFEKKLIEQDGSEKRPLLEDTASPQLADGQSYVGEISTPRGGPPSKLVPADTRQWLTTWRNLAVAIVLVAAIVALLGPAATDSWDWDAIRTRFVCVAAVLAALIGVPVFLALVFRRTARCPYCNSWVGKTPVPRLLRRHKNRQVECWRCGAWLISHAGELRVFTEADAARHETFTAPLFSDASWPDECLVCGDRALRWEPPKIIAKAALQQGLHIRPRIPAEIKRVPYCHRHCRGVQISLRGRAPRLIFQDLVTRDRYLAVNSVAFAERDE